MNPWDWSAGPFLALYLSLAALLAGGAAFARARLGPAHAARAPLGELEWAYLAGGARRVGEVALLGLMRAQAATLSPKTHRIEVSSLAPLAALGAPGVSLPLGEALTLARFQAALAPSVAAIQRRLQAQGLCPQGEDVARFRWRLWPVAVALLAFGASKAVVGVSRQHHVGFLLALLVATLAFAVWASCAPTRSRAGQAALAAHKNSWTRAARAPRDEELLLAVALTGPIVLSGTAYAALYDASRQSSGDGGGDGGGGDGGGCGGCS